MEQTIKWSQVRVSMGDHYYMSDCFRFKIYLKFDKNKNRFHSLEINGKLTITPFDLLDSAKQAAEIIKKQNMTSEKRQKALELGKQFIEHLRQVSTISDQIEALDITKEENEEFEKDPEMIEITDEIEQIYEKMGY